MWMKNPAGLQEGRFYLPLIIWCGRKLHYPRNDDAHKCCILMHAKFMRTYGCFVEEGGRVSMREDIYDGGISPPLCTTFTLWTNFPKSFTTQQRDNRKLWAEFQQLSYCFYRFWKSNVRLRKTHNCVSKRRRRQWEDVRNIKLNKITICALEQRKKKKLKECRGWIFRRRSRARRKKKGTIKSKYDTLEQMAARNIETWWSLCTWDGYEMTWIELNVEWLHLPGENIHW